jgi:hypothetical protein
VKTEKEEDSNSASVLYLLALCQTQYKTVVTVLFVTEHHAMKAYWGVEV